MTPPDDLNLDLASADAGVAHRRTEKGEVGLHYLDAGEGDLLVFLHGFPHYSGAWAEQIEHFKAGRRVVAPDMRGYNLSDKPAALDQYRMRHLVEDVRSLVSDELGAERFALVGHDWGGAVAWAFALTHPELLEALVVLNAMPPFTWVREVGNPEQQAASAYMIEFEDEGAAERLAAQDFAALEALMVKSGDGWLDERRRDGFRRAWSEPGALQAMINYYLAAGMPEQVRSGKAPDGFAASLEGARVELPTLLVWGAEETYLVPGLHEGLERWIPDLRLEIVPEAGHWIAQQRPDVVNRLIADFLEEI